MIGHFLEVWGLLLVAFVAGCVLGTLAHIAIAASPWANAQIETADAIGGALAGVRLSFRGGGATQSRPRPPVAQSGSTATDPGLTDFTGEADWPMRDRGSAEPEVTDASDAAAREFAQSEWALDADAAGSGHREDEVPIPAATVLDDDLRPEPEQEPEYFSLARTDSPGPAAGTLQELPAMRPLTLSGPRNGVPDDLQRIRGIGQKNEELLNSLGIYHFGQIAAWTPAEARWVAGQLAFPDRIERDDWVGQAIILATGGDTGYVKGGNRRKGEEAVSA